jgi:transposase
MPKTQQPRDAAVFGIDLGKNVFHVVSTDTSGAVVQRLKFRRDKLLAFFEAAASALIGMEACPGSQWLARRLQAMGHTVRIMPAQFVKPYLKTNKSDTLDAEAIAEAVTRPSMRFVPVKSVDQADIQALHRIRDQMIRQRTALINQMRAFCLEYGIAMRQGAGLFRVDFPRVLANEENDLSASMRRLLSDLFEDLQRLELRIKTVTSEIEALVSRDDVARRLTTIPGIGSLGASALLAAVGDGKQFRRARDLAAWLGLTPREYSTGGKQRLLGISKRGNTYIRRLLIHGARACLIHLDKSRHRLGDWLVGLQARMHPNKVVVALANKMARMAWVILTKPGALYERRGPAFG